MKINAVRCSFLRPPGPGATLGFKELTAFVTFSNFMVACGASNSSSVGGGIETLWQRNLQAIYLTTVGLVRLEPQLDMMVCRAR